MPADNHLLAKEYQEKLKFAEHWFLYEPEKTVAGVSARMTRGMETGFVGRPFSALSLFNDWAEKCFVTLRKPDYFQKTDLSSKERFDAWHADLIHEIQAHWASPRADENGNAITIPPLSFFHAARLADAFVKGLRVKCGTRPAVLNAIRENANIVASGATLGLLHDLYKALPPFGPHQSEHESRVGYYSIQELVREFCEEYGGTPVLFDVFARNSRPNVAD